VFDFFSEAEFGGGWRAYHSLNCSEHEYKRWAEIDFLLLGPDGAFVLEVKGGRVSRKEGVWIYTDRFGREHTSSEGPFEQAKSAMYALKKMLSEKYRLASVATDNLVFGFGVVFPHIEWDLDTTEMPREIVADSSSFSSKKSFERYLKRLKTYWLSKEKRPKRVSKSDLNAIRARIRPDVDVYPAFGVRLGQALDEMLSLTSEQYERLEIIESNEKVLISGGAGTGKTFLMMQCARRERALGKSPLVIVESPVLAAHLRLMESDPSIAVSAYRDLKKADRLFDVLLVDEGQDLLDLDVFTNLSDHLVGGMENGRWRWFMDENNQACISGTYDEEALRYLGEGLGGERPARVPLLKNVRNTKEVTKQIRLWTGADVGRSGVSGDGTAPTLVVVNDQGDVGTELTDVLVRLLTEDIRLGDIGIILASTADGIIMDSLPQKLRGQCVPLDVNTVRADLKDRIVWGRADQFKGLERPAVLAVGFSGQNFARELKNELYVALTRCNYALWLFADKDLAKALSDNEAAFGLELEGTADATA
jgi:hypothetical protein